MQNRSIELLKKHGLRKTEIRKQVLNVFLAAERQAISQPDLQSALPQADYVTLYRVLDSFEEKGLIHQVVDGGHVTRYALCQASCSEHEHHDDHAHFRCHQCERTICLEGSITSKLRIPSGFKVERTHLIMEGVCDQCQ
ncbi:MAG: transcriptional repressor [Bacteroidetes bacterium]|nr:MAG: transcriptional repressor [Bacteroidota bacterium]